MSAAQPSAGAPFRLLVVTDRHRARGPLLPTVEEALRDAPPGVALLLREHDLLTRERLPLAHELRALCTERGVAMLVADRVDIALAVGADGVHLGIRGMPAAAVRRRWPALLVGVSCHTGEELVAAAGAGAHYATLSPLFTTRSKPHATTLGVEGAARLLSQAPESLPVFALGGLDEARIRLLKGLSFAGAAVVDAALGPLSRTSSAQRLSHAVAATMTDAVEIPPE